MKYVVGHECIPKRDYLGIRLDSQLSFNTHVKHLYYSAINMVFTLKSIRSCVDMNTALIIFKVHIMLGLEYGSLFCVGSNQRRVRKLQMLMNRALRICLCLPKRASASPSQRVAIEHEGEYLSPKIDVRCLN